MGVRRQFKAAVKFYGLELRSTLRSLKGVGKSGEAREGRGERERDRQELVLKG